MTCADYGCLELKDRFDRGWLVSDLDGLGSSPCRPRGLYDVLEEALASQSIFHKWITEEDKGHDLAKGFFASFVIKERKLRPNWAILHSRWFQPEGLTARVPSHWPFAPYELFPAI